MADAIHEDVRPRHAVVGSWLVDVRVSEEPSVLARDLINPLAADALVSFLPDGTVILSGSSAYPVPDEAIRGDQLLTGPAHGSWRARGELAVAVRCVALLYIETGSSEATLVLDANVELDSGNDTFSGSYAVESSLSRAWVRPLPALDGALQGWRLR